MIIYVYFNLLRHSDKSLYSSDVGAIINKTDIYIAQFPFIMSNLVHNTTEFTP